MKTIYLIIILLLSSCSLFRKTTKTTAAESFDLSKQTEMQTLDLKTSQKETQIYTWWKDSIFYQYEVIREQEDQTKAEKMNVLEKQGATQQYTTKERNPAEVLVYAGIILGIIGFVLIFKK
ncbi:MAG: hypothetical protein EOO04_31860 [Chitinophagaceae bacterium]|nr:MAG: hypothetical protein EOO04_31860 [Chitinophagaceae bacterium]